MKEKRGHAEEMEAGRGVEREKELMKREEVQSKGRSTLKGGRRVVMNAGRVAWIKGS